MEDARAAAGLVELDVVDASTIRAKIVGEVSARTGEQLRQLLLRPLYASGIRHLELASDPGIQVDRAGLEPLLRAADAYERAGGSLKVLDGESDLAIGIQDALLSPATPRREAEPATPAPLPADDATDLPETA